MATLWDAEHKGTNNHADLGNPGNPRFDWTELVQRVGSIPKDAEHPTNPISPKRIKNATKRAKSAMASERAKPKMAYPKSCFESDPNPLSGQAKDGD